MNSSSSLLQLLGKCHSLKSLKSIHTHLLVSGAINSCDLVLNKLLRLYFRLGALDNARNLFDEIPQPNSFHWTALIRGCVENYRYEEAFHLFRRMRFGPESPLSFTIASICKGLAREKRAGDRESLYGLVLKCGFDSDLTVQNAALDLFMRCGRVDFSAMIFDRMGETDVVSWNTMISGYGNNGKVDAARDLFDNSPETNAISWKSMIGGYIKAGDMEEASALFEKMPSRDSASCNVMITGYMDKGDLVGARRVFESIPSRDVGVCNLMLLGFVKSGDTESAEEFFSKMPEKNVASWAIMIDGYVKSGNLGLARQLFDQMPMRNLVSWSTMIGGYVRNGEPRMALELYECFKQQGIKPDVTFILGIISACSHLGILEIAESIIRDCLDGSSFSNLRLATGLIDMYAKCGSIERAIRVFEAIPNKDLLCYSTMIKAFANHGMSQEALSLFSRMQRENMEPDAIAFLGVLSACNHGGLVKEGRKYFNEMIEEYRIRPSERHYACMVDLLGRAGCLNEAYGLLCKMPTKPNAVVWGALLAACRVHRNVELGEVAAAELFEIEPSNSGNYVLLSSLYATAGRWDGVVKVRTMIRENKVSKNRGSSWIELAGMVHEFVMGDLSHFDSEAIYFVLELLNEDIRFLGLGKKL
ncbi:pentatricopeptide repeat-containing protein At4g02750-like [Punica granatum]|uniref:Pentatricopeptide repeat-containing protein At4g02750-like n=1 Tax=Punica granatum TaxID=22663 RepID=A0A218XRN3_PUNGR|nr:pentatricopeptide repeat-containing protein At4g02750-like [Punica granatum]XP_031398015.1 pentatricopeptide repeat-containing protein At4g02750-like [Punica granatum]OWM87845.1 hypothetical protein CDL15_Pgr019429 [Punica granatum]